MSDPVLLVERDAGVVTVTLNRPQAMNALSRELRAALVDAFTSLAFDPKARVVILTGAGRRVLRRARPEGARPRRGSARRGQRRASRT